MRILLTGGSGLLGEKITEKALTKNHTVFSIFRNNHPTNGNQIQVDLTNKKHLLTICDQVNPTCIIHTAAITNVDYCEKNKEIALKTNVDTTRTLTEYAKKKNIQLLYISTDYVFPGDQGNYNETDQTGPINYYGKTKLLGELIVQRHKKSLILRPSVIYGYQKNASRMNFATWIIDKLDKEAPINIVTDQIVSPTLNTNLAEMILWLQEKQYTGIIHTAGATQISRYDFAEKIASKLGYDTTLLNKITCDDLAWIAPRPKKSSLNISKARKMGASPWNINKSIDCLAQEITER